MRKTTMMKLSATILGISIVFPFISTQAKSYGAKEGDTFYTIATQYDRSVDALIESNPSIDPKNIYSGLLIELPPREQEEDPPKVTPTSTKVIRLPEGHSVAYSKKLNMRASAYTAHPSENGKWGAVDAGGDALKLGTIAVDTKVIPLGTKLFVTGYQFKHLPQKGLVAEARDTGSAIKGKKIDLFVPIKKKAAQKFGIQDVQVYLIE